MQLTGTKVSFDQTGKWCKNGKKRIGIGKFEFETFEVLFFYFFGFLEKKVSNN